MAEEIVRKFRHELKYMISESEALILKQRFKGIMSLDKNAGETGYLIRSLYFDDEKESAIMDKMAGTAARAKFRIRIYNYKDGFIMLERKAKQGQYIQKTSVSLTKEEYYKVYDKDYRFLLDRKEDLCKDFYFELVSNNLKPVVIVDYDRVPFVYEYGDVRVTFDENIRSAGATREIFSDRLDTYSVMPPQTLILEVKFTEFLPQIIRDMLDIRSSTYVSASKYVMCLERRLENIMRKKAE